MTKTKFDQTIAFLPISDIFEEYFGIDPLDCSEELDDIFIAIDDYIVEIIGLPGYHKLINRLQFGEFLDD